MKDKTVKIDFKTYSTLWEIRNANIQEGNQPPSLKHLIKHAVHETYSNSNTKTDNRNKVNKE